MPLCVRRIVPDYRLGPSNATMTNQEDIGPRGWVPLTLPSGGWDDLRPGLANCLNRVARNGIGLPWIPFT